MKSPFVRPAPTRLRSFQLSINPLHLDWSKVCKRERRVQRLSHAQIYEHHKNIFSKEAPPLLACLDRSIQTSLHTLKVFGCTVQELRAPPQQKSPVYPTTSLSVANTNGGRELHNFEIGYRIVLCNSGRMTSQLTSEGRWCFEQLRPQDLHLIL